MSNKFLNLTGLTYFWGKIKEQLATKVDKKEGWGLSQNDLTNELKGQYDAAYAHSQVDHAPADAEKNIVVGIKVNGTAQTVDAERVVDIAIPTGTLAGKDKISADDIDAELWEQLNDTVASGHTHANKEAVLDQLTEAHVTLLNSGIEAGAQVNVIEKVQYNGVDVTITDKTVNIEHDKYTAADSGLYKVTVDEYGHVSATAPVTAADIEAIDGVAITDTTYEQVTTTADGLMIAADKAKLDTVAEGAQVNVLEGVKVNGQAVTATEKVVDITVPTTVAQLTDANLYALKSDLTNVYVYQGSFAAVENLPAAGTEGLEVGHVYNVEADGHNYAWNGSEWDDLGGTFRVEEITNAEIDAMMA